MKKNILTQTLFVIGLCAFVFFIQPYKAHADDYSREKTGATTVKIGIMTITVNASLYCNDDCDDHRDNFGNHLKQLASLWKDSSATSFSKYRLPGDCSNSYFTGTVTRTCDPTSFCTSSGNQFFIKHINKKCESTKTACPSGFQCTASVLNCSTSIPPGTCGGLNGTTQTESPSFWPQGVQGLKTNNLASWCSKGKDVQYTSSLGGGIVKWMCLNYGVPSSECQFSCPSDMVAVKNGSYYKCAKPAKENGSCRNNITELNKFTCKTGLLGNATTDYDNAAFVWSCNGISGGTSAQCQYKCPSGEVICNGQCKPASECDPTANISADDTTIANPGDGTPPGLDGDNDLSLLISKDGLAWTKESIVIPSGSPLHIKAASFGFTTCTGGVVGDTAASGWVQDAPLVNANQITRAYSPINTTTSFTLTCSNAATTTSATIKAVIAKIFEF